MKTIHKILLLIFILFQFHFSFSQSAIQRIDPPFWWTGMKDSTLQLMIYGNDIARADVIADYPGVVLKSTTRLENPGYLVLDLLITGDARPGKITMVFEYQREIICTAEYELRAREEGSAGRKGFGREDVIYLIMPDRFSNGDRGNDTVTGMLEAANPLDPNGRHGGDIRGIRDMLDYISGLGVTSIWMTPLLENNMPSYSYHGYSITDHYRIDPRFGDNEEYKSLVAGCHQKGLKVIMDMVFNHIGSNHFWIKDLPAENWIHQFPEYTGSNYRSETAMDPYASDFDREKMLTGWFDRTMPDLNQRNKILANYLIQNSIWWIEYAGLDGIRMDTYPYSYKDFMADWMQRVLEEYPQFNVVGETWLQKESQTAYWQANSPVSGDYSSHLPAVTDFPMYYALRDAFMEEEAWTTGLARFYYVLSQDFLYADPFMNVIFADNHDLTRFYTSIGQDLKKFKMAMAFLLTTRGIPLIYYGTEFLMTGDKEKGDGYIRGDFPVGGQRSAVGGQGSALSAPQEEAYQYLNTLLNWRRSSEVIHSGRLMQFIPEKGIYTYFRYTEDHAVMVVINRNKEDRSIETARFKEILKYYRGGKDVITGMEFNLAEGITVPGETALVLDLN